MAAPRLETVGRAPELAAHLILVHPEAFRSDRGGYLADEGIALALLPDGLGEPTELAASIDATLGPNRTATRSLVATRLPDMRRCGSRPERGSRAVDNVAVQVTDGGWRITDAALMPPVTRDTPTQLPGPPILRELGAAAHWAHQERREEEIGMRQAALRELLREARSRGGDRPGAAATPDAARLEEGIFAAFDGPEWSELPLAGVDPEVGAVALYRGPDPQREGGRLVVVTQPLTRRPTRAELGPRGGAPPAAEETELWHYGPAVSPATVAGTVMGVWDSGAQELFVDLGLGHRPALDMAAAVIGSLPRNLRKTPALRLHGTHDGPAAAFARAHGVPLSVRGPDGWRDHATMARRRRIPSSPPRRGGAASPSQ